VPKTIYPGQGRLMCDGSWGRCEAEAKWVSAWRCALCPSCRDQMNYFPSGGLRRIPLAGGFIRKRFWTWNPAYSAKTEVEKDALIANGAPIPEVADLIGNSAYVRFIRLCECPREYITAVELAEIFALDADQFCKLLDLSSFAPEQMRELIDQGFVDRGFVETYMKNRPPMGAVMPMLKEVAAHYVKGIRLDRRK
jgi:hypothetical protein